MMTNNRCKRWVTTNQDEFQNPITKKIDRYIESEEIGRYEDCMAYKNCQEEQAKAAARETICCAEQYSNREPTFVPMDSHIDPELKAAKEPWCRCLATGDPNLYEEFREKAKTDEMCYCRQCYKQSDIPMVDNPRAKIYSSTHFIDYRDPAYPFIENTNAYKQILDGKFKAYKAKADAEDAKKEPRLAPLPSEEEDRVQANCIGNYECLPPAEYKKPWKEDQSWWREESDDCVKNLLKKYIWTTTYREMNKDGAALPLLVREAPTTCLERPPGDPVRAKPALSSCTLVKLGDVFEKWDRPQFRTTAQRCDTMYNNSCLDRKCSEKDAYFQEQYLDRSKYAQCPIEQHPTPTEENLRLARENKLRQPYDLMVPYFTGYQPHVAPPVCKIKKIFNAFDPYDMLSVYQADFVNHPDYDHPVQPYRPDDLSKTGLSTNPINALSKHALPDAARLSCYKECKIVPCQNGEDSYSASLECQDIPCEPTVRNFGQPSTGTTSEFGVGQSILVQVPDQLKVDDTKDASVDMDIPKSYLKCDHKQKEDLMRFGTYVASDSSKLQKGGNLALVKKMEYKACA